VSLHALGSGALGMLDMQCLCCKLQRRLFWASVFHRLRYAVLGRSHQWPIRWRLLMQAELASCVSVECSYSVYSVCVGKVYSFSQVLKLSVLTLYQMGR